MYLWINDGVTEIRRAAHQWGMTTGEAQAALRRELGGQPVRVAQIGPAGERQARMAAVMHDVNRAAGRGGLGALMGSRNMN